MIFVIFIDNNIFFKIVFFLIQNVNLQIVSKSVIYINNIKKYFFLTFNEIFIIA